MFIGNVELKGYAALAPMAGVADRTFRKLCVGFGAGYVVGEMASAKGLSMSDKKTAELLTVTPEERPMAVQLFGHEPDVMAFSAERSLSYSPDIIDINMGCPAPKVTANGGGSALMKNPRLCGEIVKAVKNAVNVPVTVKIRKGWDDNSVNAVEVARICEDNGADAIAVHGRTRAQMYAPSVDLDIIAQVKKAVSIPVIGNGDICNAQDAANMIEMTDCDYLMVGRAALGNPWIFSEISAFLGHGRILPPVSLSEKMLVMRKHIVGLCEDKGDFVGMREARKHVAWYIKGMHGAAKMREEAGRLTTIEDLDELILKILRKAGEE